MSAIEFNQVVKHYGQFQALKSVSFNVEEGDFFALLGPNGAGKTTLISILGGLAHATSGAVRIMGHDVATDYRNARRAVGIVPQELVFDPFFNVRETLQFQSGYFGLKKNDDWIDEILASLGLTDKAHSNMRALSGGMKRRVMVAQALVHKPPVIVLDEPTAGVDVELRQTLWQFIRRLNQQGSTIVLTTHYLEEAEELCNRIAMLKQGQLIALEDKATLLNKGKSRTLRIKLLDGTLPASLQPLVITQAGQQYDLKLSDVAALDDLLAQIKQAGVTLRDIEVNKPDLEDIFVETMHGTAA
ncbi:ABC transporter ATP-binding protein [Amantichitinum ursilacus]|uniref:Putative ABC transporter ATP-binding protein YxlF n=1 Tax=Amantichitinum ursilacus TaxID=857265 RepID=A0A0N0XMA0_9NEIS|nr:ABC transporter ATP-binding protein [Amantichitinum ursilacus]KPC53998.1 putative ABC transporter ATP-binding protein YxlF [Amantichitinum ursilacus]